MSHQIPIDAYAIIIGAMKCGTSSLYSYLKGHPEICPAVAKEPEFFSEYQDHGVPATHYGDLWSFDGSIHKYALEASTGYTKYPMEPNVPANMSRYGIRPRFIYIIRNPFDRIRSHFNFMQRKESWNHGIVDDHLINTSNYFLQLEQYRQYFPRESMLLLDFDVLADSPAQVLQHVYEFLEISRGYMPPVFDAKNVAAAKSTRLLTDRERTLVFDRLKDDMSRLRQEYGIDVARWGF